MDCKVKFPMAVSARSSLAVARFVHEDAECSETHSFDTHYRKTLRWAKRYAHKADRRQAKQMIEAELCDGD